jgi:LysR family glycine cleavage system transcriptional activator
LFRRRPRPLALTGCGAKLFPVLKDGLNSFAAAVARIAVEAELRPLQVTITNSFSHRWLVPRLPLWRQFHPDVALEIIGTDAVLDLRAGDADITIRYHRCPPTGLVANELFRDTFWPMGSPALLKRVHVRHAADLAQHTLIHMHWNPWEPSAPTWQIWLEIARALAPGTPVSTRTDALSFREELHAIEAVIAGQGIAILSDVLVARELASRTLVKVLDLPLPGFGFYVAHLPDHPRRALVEFFDVWARSTV